MGVLVIAEGKTFIFRSALFVGLGSVVATIIYLTPVPDQYPQSCLRSCHELDWPMICRMKLTLERYQTLTRACEGCPENVDDCHEKYCVTADGQKKSILTANRQFPGPIIQVCHNDIMVVDVVNRVPGQSFGVHWRGQDQRETPHMDGVPMVTQCPIPSFTTFQYKFRASRAGTHMWQVNTGEEMLETLFGAFIVKNPESREIHKDLYDVEDSGHIIIIHTLTSPQRIILPDPNSVTKLLINGKVQENGLPAAAFTVKPGIRYRFRVLFGGISDGCSIRFSIQDHELLVFALDGNPVKPRNVTSIRLAPGERLDFVLTANQPRNSYSINALADERCKGLTRVTADLHYEQDQKISIHTVPVKTKSKMSTELRSVSDEERNPKKHMANLGPSDLASWTPIPKELTEKPDSKFYIFYDHRMVASHTIHNTTFIAFEDIVKIPQANNITMMFPSSPLLTQSKDVNPVNYCHDGTLPKACLERSGDICECIHVLNIPLGSTVEMILVNLDAKQKHDHVFHLHGYSFYLVGSTILSNPLSPAHVRKLDEDNKLVSRLYNNPIIKDTLSLPRNGVGVLRFKANNPGYWLLDNEHSVNWSRGLSVILKVGKDSEVPAAPADFPKCGNWIGPEFFLE